MASKLQLYPMNPTSIADLSPNAGKIRSPFNQTLGDVPNRVMNDMSFFVQDSKSTYTKTEAGTPYSVQKLADTVIHKTMLDGLESWYNEIAPFEIVAEDVNTLSWTITTFDPAMAQPVPELGTVHLVSVQREAKKAQLSRVGIGYYMEMGFSQTELGRFYHFMHIMQMQSGILETIFAGTITTCIAAHHSNYPLLRARNHYRGWDVKQVFDEDAWMFGSLQKLDYSLNRLLSKATETITRMGGQATTWIVPQKFESYLASNAPEYNRYDSLGNRGPANVIDNRVYWSMVGNNRVYYSRAYEIRGEQDNMLSRNREIGEYIVARDFSPNSSDYESKHRTIAPYNEDIDNWQELDLEYMIANCQLWDVDGSVKPKNKGDYSVSTEPGGLSAEETELDLFSFSMIRDGQPAEQVDCDLFGQMEDVYFNRDHKIQLARSVRAALMKGRTVAEFEELNRDLNRGLELAARIDKLPYSNEAVTEIAKLFNVAKPAPSKRSREILGNVFNLPEVAQDPATRFIAHDKEESLDLLIPGLQTHYGLEFIARFAGAPLANERQIAARYVEASEKIALSVKDIFKRCIYFDPEFSSTAVWYPTDVGTWFEKALFPHRPSMFISDAAGGAFASAGNVDELVQQAVRLNADIASDSLRLTSLPSGSLAEVARLFMTVAAVKSIDGERRKTGGAFTVGEITAIQDAFVYSQRVPPAGNNAGTVTLAKNWGNSIAEVKSNITNAIRTLQGSIQVLGKLRRESKLQGYVNGLSDYVLQATSSGAGVGVDTLRYARSMLVSSPSFAASVAVEVAGLRAGDPSNVLLWPADPYMDELPVSRESLLRYTAHLDSRIRIASPLSKHQSSSIPGWGSSRIGERSWSFDQSSLNALTLGQQVAHNVVLPQHGHVGSYMGQHSAAASSVPAAAIEGVYGRIAGSLASTLEIPAFQSEPVAKSGMTSPLGRALAMIEGMVGQNFHASWNNLQNAIHDPLTKALALCYDATAIHRDVFQSFISNNVRLPLAFIFARPHITYNMMMAIFLKPGRETLLNAIKPGRFMMNTDSATQAHSGTLTMETACIPYNPRNIVVLHDISFNGYKGGNGCEPISPQHYRGGTGDFTGQSAFVLAVPYTHHLTAAPMSLTGHFLKAPFDVYGVTPSEELHYITAARYSSVFGWNATARSAVTRDNFFQQPGRARRNYHMLPGSFMRYNRVTDKCDTYEKGNDWHGGCVFPGMQQVHNGLQSVAGAQKAIRR